MGFVFIAMDSFNSQNFQNERNHESNPTPTYSTCVITITDVLLPQTSILSHIIITQMDEHVQNMIIPLTSIILNGCQNKSI